MLLIFYSLIITLLKPESLEPLRAKNMNNITSMKYLSKKVNAVFFLVSKKKDSDSFIFEIVWPIYVYTRLKGSFHLKYAESKTNPD